MTKTEKMLPKLSLVLGGAASGKSDWAENLLLSSGLKPVYLATARVLDGETETKVARHRSRRSVAWHTLEADLDLGPPLSGRAPDEAVLLDCATMWLTNHLIDGNDLDAAQSALLGTVQDCPCPVVVVSNEVGHGIVPQNAMARDFRERQGRLNIALAGAADLVVLVTAGLPQVLKGTRP
ncbi:bifunctional adenosylcobinamide kinase/adenosylcobinamide-phosphate guanylyltransferase [Sulfitobacter sp. D35]|uniref:bifunctional adenosylcobinamide kinase/adenosylcobinamide-phosphate guanylyltransferase n=1 Tax=Sulfitobacter sp. D35 TaxID=3083252 RepID=UPI00296FB258|nr:bifunctional adenosylcobinamide kinase/adenosylcobinamide-phosphate guanylyltransferase [Sulfitobacter sp. D35]MDW4499014.1 bifunctional adenosylcobinamide kinase/adenosylcobinamide-phosphate guanylyltransferase [Sulfitobacter sp. D35]